MGDGFFVRGRQLHRICARRASRRRRLRREAPAPAKPERPAGVVPLQAKKDALCRLAERVAFASYYGCGFCSNAASASEMVFSFASKQYL